MSKHPNLRAEHLAEGVAYMTAYQRLERGWSFERACNTPPRIKRAKAVAPRRKPRMPRFIWERADWNASARKDRSINEPRRRSQIKKVENDTSPAHIRKLRADYCNHFIKTGELDQTMQQQLMEYANEQRAANHNSQRVSNEHAARHHRRGLPGSQDDGDRNAHEISGSAASRIADFLRLP